MEIVHMVHACGLCSYLSAGLSLVVNFGTSLLSLISKYDTPGLTESVVLTGTGRCNICRPCPKIRVYVAQRPDKTVLRDVLKTPHTEGCKRMIQHPTEW